jgi:hypothetical protein
MKWRLIVELYHAAMEAHPGVNEVSLEPWMLTPEQSWLTLESHLRAVEAYYKTMEAHPS